MLAMPWRISHKAYLNEFSVLRIVVDYVESDVEVVVRMDALRDGRRTR
jgi:hypothetical protein